MLGNIFILGDSYSTFDGYIPDDYSSYYSNEGPKYIFSNPDMELSNNDVCRVEQTWWHGLISENGTFLRNCSRSGTTICNTGYDGKDNSDVSFIARMEKLIRDGYFKENKVDTLFLFGGTNDSWSNAPLGENINSDWSDDDLYNVLPAFSYLINLLVSNFPQTKIYCIINDELKNEILEHYKLTCTKNGVSYIELRNIEKINGHPTVKGMQKIKKQIIDYIKTE